MIYRRFSTHHGRYHLSVDGTRSQYCDGCNEGGQPPLQAHFDDRLVCVGLDVRSLEHIEHAGKYAFVRNLDHAIEGLDRTRIAPV